MIATRTHYFAHKPKTGGTFTREILRTKFRGRVAGGGHDPAWIIGPHVLDNRTAFGTDRDPASWYASWWLHGMNGGRRRHQEYELYGQGSSEFKDVLYGVTHPLEVTCPRRVGVIIKLQSDALDAWRNNNHRGGPMGLWTFMTLYIYGAKGAYHSGQPEWEVEYLVDSAKDPSVGLAEVLGVPHAEIAQEKPRNTGIQNCAGRFPRPEGTYRDWYDDEMLSWVQEADGWMMGLQGRKHPFDEAYAPLMRTEDLK